jgi:YbbR domain-containing protein
MKNKLFKIVTKNFGYKLFALFLAIILWSIIQGEQIIEDNREVVVHIDVPKGYAVRGDQRRVLLATVRGPMVLMSERAPLEARVKVPPLKGSKYRVRIDKEDIKDWDDRLHISIYDPYLTLYVDEEGSRTVPVRWEPQGSIADGFFIKKKIIRPSTIQLTGLKSDLARVREIATEHVELNGVSDNKSFDVHLIPPEGFSKESLSQDTVNVTIQVSEITENKRYSMIPVEPVGSDYDVVVQPAHVSVTIQGKPSTLKFIETKEFGTFVDLYSMKPGNYEKEIRVKIPPETVLIEISPAKVMVSITRKKRAR